MPRHSETPRLSGASGSPADGPAHCRRVHRYVLWALLLFASATAAADAATVRVGLYNFQPIVFRDENDHPKGIGITIIKHAARQEGWDLRFVDGTWTECLEGLESGRIDIVPGVSYTAERAIHGP